MNPKTGSLPPREAWIEIFLSADYPRRRRSLPPREAWIEILMLISTARVNGCRFPRGKRGLKWLVSVVAVSVLWSLPPREAWIEI